MGVLLTMLVGALATTLAFVPRFLTTPDDGQEWQVWLLIGAAPLAALAVNLLLPAATTGTRAMLTGLPQILLFPVLFNVDIGIQDRRGYYLSGELDVARGFGSVFFLGFGFLVMFLVAAGALIGTWLRGRRR